MEITPKCGHTVASGFKIVGSVFDGASVTYAVGTSDSLTSQASFGNWLLQGAFTHHFHRRLLSNEMQPQLDRSDYTANTKRGWGALAQSAGVEDFRGVEDFWLVERGYFHHWISTQIAALWGVRTSCRLVGLGGRGGVPGPRDQWGQGHPPRSAWMNRQHPRNAELAVFSPEHPSCAASN